MAPKALAAPIVCPSIDLIELSGGAAFGRQDSGTMPIEWRADVLRQRAQPVEAGMHPPAYRLGAAGDHHVEFAERQTIVRITKSVVTRGASGRNRQRFAARANLL